MRSFVKLTTAAALFMASGPLAAQQNATDAGLPMIAPSTGEGFLRDPSLKNVINMPAIYDTETQAWIDHLVDDLGLTEIAILYEDDGFGRVGLNGVTAALETRGSRWWRRASTRATPSPSNLPCSKSARRNRKPWS